jgi:hypothetical protein
MLTLDPVADATGHAAVWSWASLASDPKASVGILISSPSVSPQIWNVVPVSPLSRGIAAGKRERQEDPEEVTLDAFVDRRGRGPWSWFLYPGTDSVVVPTSHRPNLYCALYEMKVLFLFPGYLNQALLVGSLIVRDNVTMQAFLQPNNVASAGYVLALVQHFSYPVHTSPIRVLFQGSYMPQVVPR